MRLEVQDDGFESLLRLLCFFLLHFVADFRFRSSFFFVFILGAVRPPVSTDSHLVLCPFCRGQARLWWCRGI